MEHLEPQAHSGTGFGKTDKGSLPPELEARPCQEPWRHRTAGERHFDVFVSCLIDTGSQLDIDRNLPTVEGAAYQQGRSALASLIPGARTPWMRKIDQPRHLSLSSGRL